MFNFFSHPLEFVIGAIGLLFSLVVHEFAHAWVADYLGDPTPRMQGRVTLKPQAHLDPVGTLAMLFVGFGWGKPVEIDSFNLKNPIRDSAIIALAGPGINLVIAGLIAVVVHLFALPVLVTYILVNLAATNVVLAIFNLVPIYPLDGSKIVLPLLPRALGLEYEQFMQRFGLFVMIALIIPWYNGASPIWFLLSPVRQFILTFLFG